MSASLRHLLGVPPGAVDLRAFDTAATPGAPGDKTATRGVLEDVAGELGDLQEQLYAMADVEQSPRRLLLVLQGMDASGKDGAIKRGLDGMNPKWMRIKGFSAPNEEEQRHHFLWRIRRELPPPGIVGVFARSHYEDVLAVRVHDLQPEEVWRPRFEEINAFERRLVADGFALVKVFLHISPGYQRERQLRRLDRVDKRWKFDPGDLEDRARWDAYMTAYAEVLERCNQPEAPWFVVPADRKWYRTWAVAQLVRETLQGMQLHWPSRPDLDIPALRARLLES